MLIKLLTKVFGSRDDHTLHQAREMANTINTMEPEMEKLSDEELERKTTEFRTRLEEGEVLGNLTPEAFAVMREASKRVSGMCRFGVQLLGSMVLNERCIAEMCTGESKALTATLSAYLNALTGKGVHVVTVNGYLAQRDAENDYPLSEFLGLATGISLPNMSTPIKRETYVADITYGTNNEYGFDYLRDNMAFSSEEHVQHKLHYALVDEVNSTLIDKAHTPLIISGPTGDNSEVYKRVNKIIPYLIRQEKEGSETFQGEGHFSVDEKSRQVNLTERSLVLIEELLVKRGIMDRRESLYSPANIMLIHHIAAVLYAHTLFTRGVDYIVRDSEVITVDGHTGRIMQGHRWFDGLHRAAEAKKGMQIQNENQTPVLTIFQSYFHLYEKLAGITGTIDTEAFEFSSIYKLDTVVVPTNRPMICKDLLDLVYMTGAEKVQVIIEDIKERTAKGQSVLVGTILTKKSKLVSSELTKADIEHNVLSARFHASEAAVVVQAGYSAAVTIATNMADHGTDIVLGGSWQTEVAALENPTIEQVEKIKVGQRVRHDAVLAAGDPHIIDTKRHRSRRIDNQLYGRFGRWGNIGSSHFYPSMENTLVRISAPDRISGMMCKLGMKPDEAIEHPWTTKAITSVRCKVKSHNFDIRKQLLGYGDVTNDQRRAIYSQCNELLDVSDASETVNSIREDVFKATIDAYISPQSLEEMQGIPGLQECLKNDLDLDLPIAEWLDKEPELHGETLRERILTQFIEVYQRKGEVASTEMVRHFEKGVALQTLDSLWKKHLIVMDYLHQGIHLRGYAQKDPKQEYKREPFSVFAAMLELLKHEVISTLSRVQVRMPEEVEELKQQRRMEAERLAQMQQLSYQDDDFAAAAALTAQTGERKVGHNDSCSCDSGKECEQCHGRLQ